MAQRQQIGFRATKDVAKRLQSFAEDHDLNVSQATETLVDDALRSKGYTNGDAADRGLVETILLEAGKAMLYVAASFWILTIGWDHTLDTVAVVLTTVGFVLVGGMTQYDRLRARVSGVVGS